MAEAIINFLRDTGFYNISWQQAVMILVSFVLMYLAIVKKYEPLLLLPIAFGMFLANFPLGGVNDLPSETLRYLATVPEALKASDLTAQFSSLMVSGEHLVQHAVENGVEVFAAKSNYGGLLYYLGRGVKLGIYPPLIFMGIGAMTDFAPLISNPKSILLGGAAQLGIFGAYIGAMLLGFTPQEAGSIGIIGGADGPTALYLTAKLADHLLGPIAVAAYSYMALVPVIQPPIMKALTTKKERQIVMSMDSMRPVSKTEKIVFPIAVTTLVGLILPSTVPLLGMLMFGNLMKESGVVDRINKTAQNELMNIVTIFLGISVGSTATAEAFLNAKTLGIMVMGVTAFALGTAGGVLLAKLMNVMSVAMGGKPVNPLIGSAGVSAVPMAARVSQVVGQKENPSNFLLMHAMGPNVAGVIGSAIAAGILLSVLG
ncbi:MAG: sodium ion-translocating decarboxylase subunit beta [Oscillospiraceae bacterium]|nr:sodium ion-translocating decarboxylase subunit beta [Oscillospiraceae bacterium]